MPELSDIIIGALVIIGLLILYYKPRKPHAKVPESNVVNESKTIQPLHDFNWESTSRRTVRHFKPIYNITLAIQSDVPSELIEMDQQYRSRILERRRLISEFPDTVHGLVPGGEGPVKELYTFLLTKYLPNRFPTMFEVSANGETFQNLVTGESFPTRPPSDLKLALRSMGTIVEDDLFLLVPTSEGHRLVAVMCAFPSGFNPSEKLGLLLKDVHGPVPGYEKIGPSMERFFTKLEPNKPAKRMNWSIQTHPELCNCNANPLAKEGVVSDDPDINIEETYFRYELQTLSRLPETRAILFSFKTYMDKVSDLKEEGRGLDLAEAIDGLTKGNVPDMWQYKGAPVWAKSLSKYLRS